MTHRRILGLGIGIVLGWLALHAQVAVQPRTKQGTRSPPRPTTNLRVDTDLVLVPVAVSDPRNRPVTGLEREHFKLFDDKIEQKVTHFSMDDEPVAVGMVFDVSGSMGNKLRMARVAAAEFFKTSNVEDEFFLVTFSDQVKLTVGLTKDVQEIQNQLTFAQSKGRTALLDAIMMSMHEMKKSKKNRKALVVISDGGDNSSRYSENEVRNMVRENDVLIYAIGVYEHGRRTRPYGGRGGGSGAARRHGRADRRAALPRRCERVAGHRDEDRRRAAQSVRARLHADGQADATAGITRSTSRSSRRGICRS